MANSGPLPIDEVAKVVARSIAVSLQADCRRVVTDEDAAAITAFLQNVKPVNHRVPGPFKPGEKIATFMLRIVPPGQTAAGAPN